MVKAVYLRIRIAILLIVSGGTSFDNRVGCYRSRIDSSSRRKTRTVLGAVMKNMAVALATRDAGTMVCSLNE